MTKLQWRPEEIGDAMTLSNMPKNTIDKEQMEAEGNQVDFSQQHYRTMTAQILWK